MKLPKSLITVTTFSKILAVLIFFLLLLGAFYAGLIYQSKLDSKNKLLLKRSEDANQITSKNENSNIEENNYGIYFSDKNKNWYMLDDSDDHQIRFNFPPNLRESGSTRNISIGTETYYSLSYPPSSASQARGPSPFPIFALQKTLLNNLEDKNSTTDQFNKIFSVEIGKEMDNLVTMSICGHSSPNNYIRLNDKVINNNIFRVFEVSNCFSSKPHTVLFLKKNNAFYKITSYYKDSSERDIFNKILTSLEIGDRSYNNPLTPYPTLYESQN